jgi:hypothetical protein
MIKQMEELNLEDWKKVSKYEGRLFKGIPDCLRGKVWGLIFDKLNIDMPDFNFEDLAGRATSYDHQIDLDIERTMRNHIHYLKRYGPG